MIAFDVRICVYQNRGPVKAQLVIESANGTRLLDTFIEDLTPDQRALLNTLFEQTGRHIGALAAN